MSDYTVGESEGDWILRERKGHLELWENMKSGNLGVYLYENEGRGENWLLHAIRGSEDGAREVFNTVSAILG